MLACWREFFVVADRRVTSVKAGEECATRGGADAGAGVGLGEEHAAGCEGIDVWSFDELLTITADLAKSQIIGDDEDDIGRRLFAGESSGCSRAA